MITHGLYTAPAALVTNVPGAKAHRVIPSIENKQNTSTKSCGHVVMQSCINHESGLAATMQPLRGRVKYRKNRPVKKGLFLSEIMHPNRHHQLADLGEHTIFAGHFHNGWYFQNGRWKKQTPTGYKHGLTRTMCKNITWWKTTVGGGGVDGGNV